MVIDKHIVCYNVMAITFLTCELFMPSGDNKKTLVTDKHASCDITRKTLCCHDHNNLKLRTYFA